MKHYTCVDSVGNISTAPKDRQKSNRYGTQDCLNRLFSYEATGFEPEQVTELRDHSIELENRCIQMDKAYRELAERYAALEKENEWIPVSERLPKEDTLFQCTVHRFEDDYHWTQDMIYFQHINEWYWNDDDMMDRTKFAVTAWKPLDVPYKESDNHGNDK